MPASSVRELNKAISGGKLEPVYLLHGEEAFLRDAKVTQIVDAALQPAERDFNFDTRYGADLSAEDLESLVGTPPLFATRRVVVVKDVLSLKKNARKVLDGYLEKPASDVVLILVADGTLPKTEKTLPGQAAVVEFAKLSGDDILKWVDHHATNTLSSSITSGATRLLVQAVGEDIPQLASELEKLVSFSSGGEIDESAVEELVGIRRGETLVDLLDAVAMRDAAKALAVVGPVLMQPRTTAVSVILALSAQIFGTSYARALLDSSTPTSRIPSALFAFLKKGRSFTARPWGEAVSAWTKAAKNWSAADLERAREVLLLADVRLKESRISSDEDVLTLVIMELCARDTTPARTIQKSR